MAEKKNTIRRVADAAPTSYTVFEPSQILEHATKYKFILEREHLADLLRKDRLLITYEPILKDVLAHLEELRDAWQRGCLSEHDGLGGTRSNRNMDVCIRLRTAMEGQ